MTRVLAVITLVVVLAGAAYVVGCAKKQQPPEGPMTGPVEPLPVEPSGIEPAAGEYTYVCPHHPDQTAEEPGKCPTCGAYMKADTDEEVEYYCPDHPEVVQDEPGEHEGTPLVGRPKAAPVEEASSAEAKPETGEGTSEEGSSTEEEPAGEAPSEI
jgi:hypothetical protein